MEPDIAEHSTSGIPVFATSNSGGLDFWVASCERIFGVNPINKGDSGRNHSMDSWHVAPLTITRSKYCSMVNHHAKRHMEELGNQIHVHRYARGFASIETGGSAVECQPRDITLLDFSRPFTSLHKDNVCEGIFLPHEAINYQPSDEFHSPVYSEDSTIGRLLGREMDFLFRTLEEGATAIDPADILRVLGCIEYAMSPDTATMSARAQARESLKRAIQSYIEAHLELPELCVSLILRNFGVSRASLYRMFEREDGVRNYISRRRLHRAVTDLAITPHSHGKIHQTSERWGFSSAANFNRVVKREFGVTPGSLFQMPISDQTQPQHFSPLYFLMRDAAKRIPKVKEIESRAQTKLFA